MMSATPDTLEFKTAIKEAMIELLQERGDLFAAIFAEALEDLGLLRAIDAGRTSDFVSRDEIMDILDATR